MSSLGGSRNLAAVEAAAADRLGAELNPRLPPHMLSILRWFVIAAGFGLIVLTYIPLLWLGVMSLNTDPLSGVPRGFTLRWYRELAIYTDWVGPLLLSLAMASAVAVFCMVVATVVGRAIPRMRRQGGILLLLLLPLFVPGLTIGAALFLFFRSYLGLPLGSWSVFVGHVVWAFPFSLLLVVVMASRLDHRLLEAAGDLGASPWEIFGHIELPLLRPAIVGAGLFAFLLSFNELLRTLFLRGFATTLPIYQLASAAAHQTQVAVTYALATLIFLVAVPAVALLCWFLFVTLAQPQEERQRRR